MRIFVVFISLVPFVRSLSPLPRGLSNSLRSSAGTNNAIRKSVSSALGRALSDGKDLLEVEFPPRLERQGFFDDYDDADNLDANRDFAVQLAVDEELAGFAPGESLWLCFVDETETELAVKAWPGMNYRAATMTWIEAAVTALGREALIPITKKPFDFIGGLLGGSKAPAAMPAPALQLVVQPGDCGAMEDWFNLERLKVDGTPMICLNGGFEKVTSGYYSNFLNPDLAKCSDRFISRFEPVYYLKNLGMSKGWLHRVYGEPWQLYRATQEGTELVETYLEKPSGKACLDRLNMP